MSTFDEKIAQIQAYKDIYDRLTYLVEAYESQIESQQEYATNPDHWNYEGACDLIAATKIKKATCERIMNEMIKRV